MRILFCDDNKEILTQLRQYVTEYFQRFPSLQLEYAAYLSGDELIAKENVADIAFLDVEMPGMNGIQVGAKLKEWNPDIKIFIVTNYPDYLDEAMRYQVFRYLSKPIDKGRLFRNLKDAIYQYDLESKELLIETKEGLLRRKASELVFIEASQGRVFVCTTRETVLSVLTMNDWKKILTSACFYPTHRNYIINMEYVNKIGRDKVLLCYHNQYKEVYLTRRKYSDFKKTFLLYLENTR